MVGETGTVVTNSKLQIMQFNYEGNRIEHRGDPSLGRYEVSLKAMQKFACKEGGGILVECNGMEELESKLGMSVFRCFWRICRENMKGFLRCQKDYCLLKKRSKDGINPISVGPYRYP